MPKDPVDVALGRRIRAWRLAARLTRKELAGQLGISEDKLLNIEVCRSRLYLGDVLEIARVLGVPLTDLLGDFAPVPSLDWYFTACNPALARRAPDSIEQRIAATLWLERHFAQLYRLDYRRCTSCKLSAGRCSSRPCGSCRLRVTRSGCSTSRMPRRTQLATSLGT